MTSQVTNASNAPSADHPTNNKSFHVPITPKLEDELLEQERHQGSISLTPFPCLTSLRPTNAVGTPSAASFETILKLKDLHDAVQRISASLAAAIHAACAALLYQYTDAKEYVAFNTVASIGFQLHLHGKKDPRGVVDTCVCRIEDVTSKKAAALLQCLTKRTRGNNDHDILAKENSREAFSQLIAEAVFSHVVNDSMSGFVAQHAPGSTPEEADNNVSIVASSSARGMLELTVMFHDVKLNELAAQLMLRHLAAIIANLVYNPDQPVSYALSNVDNALLSIIKSDLG